MRTKDLEEKVQIDDTVKPKESKDDLSFRVIEVRGKNIKAVTLYGENEYRKKIKYLIDVSCNLVIIKKSKRFLKEQDEEVETDGLLGLLNDDSFVEESNTNDLLNSL